eukprot:2023689-Rhodomonas_salina.2
MVYVLVWRYTSWYEGIRAGTKAGTRTTLTRTTECVNVPRHTRTTRTDPQTVDWFAPRRLIRTKWTDLGQRLADEHGVELFHAVALHLSVLGTTR